MDGREEGASKNRADWAEKTRQLDKFLEEKGANPNLNMQFWIDFFSDFIQFNHLILFCFSFLICETKRKKNNKNVSKQTHTWSIHSIHWRFTIIFSAIIIFHRRSWNWIRLPEISVVYERWFFCCFSFYHCHCPSSSQILSTIFFPESFRFPALFQCFRSFLFH